MSRSRDIRLRVREAADAISLEGLDPSLRLVRERLGGTGSNNTILSELKAWRDARERAIALAERQVEVATDSKDLVKKLEAFGTAQAELAQLVQETRTMAEALAQGMALFTEARHTWAGLADQLREEKAWMRDELGKLNDRFEGVQKRMLLSVEEAREETRRWKEAAAAAKDELLTWRVTMQQRIESLTTENGRLRGMLESSSGSRGE